MKTGVMSRNDIPIGKFDENIKYKTACRNSYIKYN
jgi:hypothetical protein